MQAAPCLGDLQATQQDLLQRKQALHEWHDQLAHHAGNLEQQKQFLEQQRLSSSAGMHSYVADQLQRQQTDLEQKYLPAIQALEQQRDFLQLAAGTEADKAAEVLHQKEQEWMRQLASAQQDALQQLQQMQQQAQQKLQQKQQEWNAAFGTAQQNAQQALQQKQQEMDASRASANQHAQQTVDDAVKRRADALQEAVAAAQQEAQQAKQEAQQAQQEAQQAQQVLHTFKQSAHSSTEQTQQQQQHFLQAAQQQTQAAQQALHELKASSMATAQTEKQQAAHRQQQLTASLQAMQQLAEKAEARAKQAEQQTAAWQAQASSKAARLAEVEQKLEQVRRPNTHWIWGFVFGRHVTGLTLFPSGIVGAVHRCMSTTCINSCCIDYFQAVAPYLCSGCYIIQMLLHCTHSAAAPHTSPYTYSLYTLAQFP